jgi:hypothetical protein
MVWPLLCSPKKDEAALYIKEIYFLWRTFIVGVTVDNFETGSLHVAVLHSVFPLASLPVRLPTNK